MAAAAQRKLLPPKAARAEREIGDLKNEVSSAINELADGFDKAAKQTIASSKMTDVATLLADVMRTVAPSPHEAPADRKRLDAALTRVVTSLRAAATCKPMLLSLKTKMKAVATAAPASAEHRCAYAEALVAAAARDAKADPPGEQEAAVRKYLEKARGGGGGGGGGGEEDLEIAAPSGDEMKAHFTCPISQAQMKQPMK